MATVRIYVIAGLLNTTSQEVMALLKRDHGIELESASNQIEEVVARQFVERLARRRGISLPSGEHRPRSGGGPSRLGVTLAESIDTTTPAGRLQLHVLSAIRQFERDRISERVRAGLQRARTQGKRLGRPQRAVPVDRISAVQHLPLDEAAQALGVSRSTVKRWRRRVQKASPTAA